MATTLYSLSKLFTDRFYRIPDFQRGYAWTSKQLQDFWSDLTALEDGQKHYAGVITLEEVPAEKWKQWKDDLWLIKTRGFEPFYVVDGQQRLTTALILIQCFLEATPEVNGRLNLTSPKDIRKRFIAESSDRITQTFLFGYDTGNHSHKFLIDVIFSQTQNRRGIQETAYTANLDNAKAFFTERVKALTSEERDRIYKALAHQLHFNVFEIEEEVDVHVAFESMNNRGKPLSHLELLKNRLIYLTTKLTGVNTVSDLTRLRSQINEAWRAVYHNLGKDKNRLLDDDQFLFTQSLIYFGQHYTKDIDDYDGYYRFNRSFRSAYSASLLEEIFTSKNLLPPDSGLPPETDRNKLTYNLDLKRISDYVKDLQHSVELWFDILNPLLSNLSEDEKLWLDRLNRINSRLHLPLILATFTRERDVAARLRILKAVEKHYFVFSVLSPGYVGGEVQASPLLIEFLKGKLPLDKVAQKLVDEADSLAKDKYFENALRQIAGSPRGFYGWVGVRYFLYEFEQELRSRSKVHRDKIIWSEFCEPPADHVSVEHIFPQKAVDPYWIARFKGLTPKKKNILLGSLGNLLALSKPKNSSLQNASFPEKKGDSKKLVGYRYGSLSENKVAEETEWGPTNILGRSLELVRFMERRWGLKLGDDGRIFRLLQLDSFLP